MNAYNATTPNRGFRVGQNGKVMNRFSFIYFVSGGIVLPSSPGAASSGFTVQFSPYSVMPGGTVYPLFSGAEGDSIDIYVESFRLDFNGATGIKPAAGQDNPCTVDPDFENCNFCGNGSSFRIYIDSFGETIPVGYSGALTIPSGETSVNLSSQAMNSTTLRLDTEGLASQMYDREVSVHLRIDILAPLDIG